jgi:DNA-binding response OmpR family regulator
MDKDKKSKGRIVYIDDEVDACETIVEFFNLRGFETLVAFDALSGYDLIKSANPDLVIVDLKMAGVSGVDLLQRLRDENLRMPVIVVTAFQEAIAEVRNRGLAVDRIFTKPYSLADLHDVVKGLVEVVR